MTHDFAVLGERLITIEQTLSALNTQIADRDETVSATIAGMHACMTMIKYLYGFSA